MTRFIFIILIFNIFLIGQNIKLAHHIGFYIGKYADANLINISPKILKGELKYKKIYIYSLSYFQDVYEIKKDKLRVRVGGSISSHSKSNVEVTANIGLSLIDVLPQNSFLKMDLYFATGLSYVFGSIEYEDGTKKNPNKKYHLQSSEIMQIDFYSPNSPQARFFIRLHHRSGIYGLIAPRHVGSNFLGVGVSYVY